MIARLTALVRAFHEQLFRYAWKFAVVGVICYVIDVVVFNVLRITVLSPDAVRSGPVIATVISTVVSTVAAWFGNRYWAFRDHRRKGFMLELGEAALAGAIGLGITMLCLWLSHYVLGYRSLLADNISKNVIGLAIATAFRFFAYRYIVFSPKRKDSRSRVLREAEEREVTSPSP
jgi:putative flippase GtrA